MNILEKVIIGLVGFFVFMIVISIVSFVIALFVFLLWNWLMPSLFNLPRLTYIQAWGLTLLTSFLLRGGTSKKNE